LILVNDIPVLQGNLSFPVSGAWVARFEVIESQPEVGPCVLSDGEQEISGYIVDSGLNGARVNLSIIGGAGGLGTNSPAQHYKSAKVSKVVEDICGDTGESLSAASDQSLLRRTLGFWSAPSGTGGQSLTLITRQLGSRWGVDVNGEILIGYDEGDEASEEYNILDSDFSHNKYLIAPEGIGLRPGMLQQERQVKAVQYMVTETIRAIYYT
jgi:hypothetical protein